MEYRLGILIRSLDREYRLGILIEEFWLKNFNEESGLGIFGSSNEKKSETKDGKSSLIFILRFENLNENEEQKKSESIFFRPTQKNATKAD